MTIPVKQQPQQVATLEDVLIRGNLNDLTPDQRTDYYKRVCQSIGLNPLTRPFDYLTLNGKLVLYARRDCADQLRKINGISIEIVSQDRVGDLLSVHVRAKDKWGRMDEDLGVVSMPATLKGEAAANTILKAVTKAKRRVTLSISGLGFLDETEVEDIPQSAKTQVADMITDERLLIDAAQLEQLNELLATTGRTPLQLCNKFGFIKMEDIPSTRFQDVKNFLEEIIRKENRQVVAA